MLKNILDNVLSSGSNGSDDKIKELLNSIIGSNYKKHVLELIAQTWVRVLFC